MNDDGQYLSHSDAEPIQLKKPGLRKIDIPKGNYANSNIKSPGLRSPGLGKTPGLGKKGALGQVSDAAETNEHI